MTNANRGVRNPNQPAHQSITQQPRVNSEDPV